MVVGHFYFSCFTMGFYLEKREVFGVLILTIWGTRIPNPAVLKWVNRGRQCLTIFCLRVEYLVYLFSDFKVSSIISFPFQYGYVDRFFLICSPFLFLVFNIIYWGYFYFWNLIFSKRDETWSITQDVDVWTILDQQKS